MSLRLSIVAAEDGPAIAVEADDSPVPPEIALAFGRALVAASEVLIGLHSLASNEPDDTPQPDLPVYPRQQTRTL